MSGESADQMRKLLNETTDCVEAVKAMGVDTKDWYYFLVPLTVNRFDRSTHKDWEDSIAGDAEPVKFDIFTTFLQKRLRTLDSINSGETSKKTKTGSQKSQARKSNNNSRNNNFKVSHNV